MAGAGALTRHPEATPLPGLTTIVVVVHNSADVLPRCLQALVGQSGHFELVVVDNGSGDAGLAAIPPEVAAVTLRNEDNPGFAAACNQGAQAARGDALLFLNPDCFLPEESLAELRSLLDGDRRIGLLGAQLLNVDGSEQAASHRLDPTPDRLLQALLRGRSAIEQPATVETSLQFIEAVSGALMLVRRDVFESVGGFDHGYRLHFEDLDLCRRVRNAGHRVAVANTVRVPHLKGSSSRRRPLWVEWHKHRGLWRYYNRFDAGSHSIWLRAGFSAMIGVRALLGLARAAVTRPG